VPEGSAGMRQSVRAAAREGPKDGRHPSFAEMQAEIDVLKAELQEARAQQTAAAEVLGVINSSPGDLAPVFDSILDRAMALCDAAFGTFLTYDGKEFALVASRGIPAALVEYRTRNPVSTDPDTVAARLRDRTDLLHIPDLMAEDAYRNGNPDRRAFVDLGGAHTALGAALRKDGLLLGQIFIFRQGGASLHRQADRAVAELRCSSGDRDGKCAAVHRDTRSLGAADRHR
jgi:hypothetical protein